MIERVDSHLLKKGNFRLISKDDQIKANRSWFNVWFCSTRTVWEGPFGDAPPTVLLILLSYCLKLRVGYVLLIYVLVFNSYLGDCIFPIR